jgi:apolipoprotein N-acyltransferase
LNAESARRHRPVGITLLVIFFAAGSLICLMTMLALAFPGGFLEPIWQVKPEALAQFQQIGNWSVALMAVVGVACGLAALGLAKNAEWGRRLAIGILTINLIGDSLNALLRHDPRTLIGLPIGGLMILYLMKRGRQGRRAQ